MAVFGRGAIGVTFANGSIIYGSGGQTSELTVGAQDQVLSVGVSNSLVWKTMSMSALSDVTGTFASGDIIAHDGTNFKATPDVKFVSSDAELTAAYNAGFKAIFLAPGSYTTPNPALEDVNLYGSGLGTVLTGPTSFSSANSNKITVWRDLTVNGSFTTNMTGNGSVFRLDGCFIAGNFTLNGVTSNNEMRIEHSKVNGTFSVNSGEIHINNSFLSSAGIQINGGEFYLKSSEINTNSASDIMTISSGFAHISESRLLNAGAGNYLILSNGTLLINAVDFDTSGAGKFLTMTGGTLKVGVTDLDFEDTARVQYTAGAIQNMQAGLPFNPTLTAGASIVWNADESKAANLLLTTNTVISAIQGFANGETLTLAVQQDATGSRTFAFDPSLNVAFSGGTYTPSSAANAMDLIRLFKNGSVIIASVTPNVS